MKSVKRPNVSSPEGFLEKFQQAIDALYGLFESCREAELAPYADDGCMVYDEDYGKLCFQVAGQFERSGEFLDSLMDMLRVTYEASWGTLLLNSNPGFIFEAVPTVPFTLGYLSVLGKPSESFSDMWQGEIANKLVKHGYNLGNASALFVVVAGSEKRMGFELIEEVNKTTKAGFTVDGVLGLFAAELGNTESKPQKASYAGFVSDYGFDDRLRVSIWLFIEERQRLKIV